MLRLTKRCCQTNVSLRYTFAAKRGVKWIEKILDNVVGIEVLESLKDMKPELNERDGLSLMLHFVVFDTQRAIFDLVRLKHFGAASALLRVLFETHVKAEWLKVCASDKQVDQFKRDSVKSAKNQKLNYIPGDD